MKIKVQDLTGVALDWAVAKCEGRESTFGHGFAAKFAFYPSKRWSQGGPIIEREKIALTHGSLLGPKFVLWHAVLSKANDVEDTHKGQTPLIAAMRCYVASKLGDEVEIPEELK